jgi:hypothetical protein
MAHVDSPRWLLPAGVGDSADASPPRLRALSLRAGSRVMSIDSGTRFWWGLRDNQGFSEPRGGVS